MVRNAIEKIVGKAIKKAQKKKALPPFEMPDILLERPKQAEHGDYATPVCLGLARLARTAPVKIAETIVSYLPQADYLGKVEVAHPGYINFTLAESWLARQVEEILQAGESFGNINLGEGRKVQVEFVSANPTGPLHVGTGRNAVLGDSLANVLEAAGYQVQREYYVNDAGTQMRLFTETLYARYAQALGRDVPLPEDGYQGAYMVEMGRQIAAESGDKFLALEREEALAALEEVGVRLTLDGIREDLEGMGIYMDNWFSEKSVYQDGTFGRVMTVLRQGEYIREYDGAVWFASADLGQDKDNVIIRSDGNPGYFASDIAYHYNKFVMRGFDWVIDVWAADHQGHVPRMKAMMRSLELAPERLTILLYQLVTLKRGGEPVRLSKRTGEIITLREVLDEVGPEAVRFFLLARAADSQMDFDLDLARQESDENPAHYVRYAHARIASILRYAAEQGASDEGGDVSLLTHPLELALIRQMLRLPEIIELATLNLAPHHLPFYSQELAASFHSFYKECRVISSDPADAELSKARLKLIRAAKTVIARVLLLMGIEPPEQM
jgi:arginyl-tRNA synthetase